jgi:hypothetical protein
MDLSPTVILGSSPTPTTVATSSPTSTPTVVSTPTLASTSTPTVAVAPTPTTATKTPTPTKTPTKTPTEAPSGIFSFVEEGQRKVAEVKLDQKSGSRVRVVRFVPVDYPKIYYMLMFADPNTGVNVVVGGIPIWAWIVIGIVILLVLIAFVVVFVRIILPKISKRKNFY